MKCKNYISAPALMVFLAFVLSACLDDDIKPLEPGAKAPPFTLALLDGGSANMESPHGNGHIVTFMASWCPCSNESIPFMKDAFERYKNKDVKFLMISIQDVQSKFEKFVEKWEVPFPAGFDDGDKIARIYGVKQPPTTVFIDRNGMVKRFFYGNIKDKESEFPKWLDELLS